MRKKITINNYKLQLDYYKLYLSAQNNIDHWSYIILLTQINILKYIILVKNSLKQNQ